MERTTMKRLPSPMGNFSRALAAAILLLHFAPAGAEPQRPRDYLTQIEADKIRAAETPGLRIRLFLSFADDRLKKFQYELTRPSQDRNRNARLNALLSAYTGCMDDAAGLMELAREKQQDIQDGLKEMKKKAPEFLAYLEGLAGEERAASAYREMLEDAVAATKEAIEESKKAEKEIAPPPVRRRP
jgi:hypothetical protein